MNVPIAEEDWNDTMQSYPTAQTGRNRSGKPADTSERPSMSDNGRVLEIVRETMTRHPELTVDDVIESLNDAYCELQDENG